MRGDHEDAACIPESAELLGMWEMRRGMRHLRSEGLGPASDRSAEVQSEI